MSLAKSKAIWFSKPCCFRLEKGRLSGSAQTRSFPSAIAGVHASNERHKARAMPWHRKITGLLFSTDLSKASTTVQVYKYALYHHH